MKQINIAFEFRTRESENEILTFICFTAPDHITADDLQRVFNSKFRAVLMSSVQAESCNLEKALSIALHEVNAELGCSSCVMESQGHMIFSI